MQAEIRKQMARELTAFHLPRYEDIPNVGLYLEQTVGYIADYLQPLQTDAITSSMISNYVKKKLVANPIRKQYNREQIATLLFIAVTKSVLSLEHIRVLLTICRERYDSRTVYHCFCEELESAVCQVFGVQATESQMWSSPALVPAGKEDSSEERYILKNTITAVVHKIYLEQWIRRYAKAKAEDALHSMSQQTDYDKLPLVDNTSEIRSS